MSSRLAHPDKDITTDGQGTGPGAGQGTGPAGGRAGKGTTWLQDLLMGVRFAVAGGREGWIRTALTALGVGLGVALLLATTAIPAAIDARDQRDRDRSVGEVAERKGPDAVLVKEENTQFRDLGITGRLLQAEGRDAPVPPGLTRLPGPGEIMVSPELAALLDTPEGRELLAPRFPYERVGTISEAGLIGPKELAFYAGTDAFTGGEDFVTRVTSFGDTYPSEPWDDPVLLLLVVVMFVVLLTPVAIFVATAVRFGGERRDRRLAALRLVGADAAGTRRIAAGEAAAGALLGVLAGFAFFLAVRQLADDFTVVIETRFFPSDFAVDPALALLVTLAVPCAAVLVTLFAMRGVVVEPLGVVRASKTAKRRLWWRLVLPLAGLGLLYPMIGQGEDDGEFSEWQVTGGVVLLLVGVTALLPWLVAFTVARLGGGPVSWQLAVRRLQMSSSAAARPVNGIAVAVAGAIALQTFFVSVQGDYQKDTGMDPSRAQLQVMVPRQTEASRIPGITKTISEAKGVTRVTALGDTEALADNDPEGYFSVTVGDCAALALVAKLDTCSEGDLFLLRMDHEAEEYTPEGEVKPGQKVLLNPDGSAYEPPVESVRWTVPEDAETAEARRDPTGLLRDGIIATPSALPGLVSGSYRYSAYVTLDPAVPDAREYARNAVAQADPLLYPVRLEEYRVVGRFQSVTKGLLIGSVAVMLLIGASLFVSQMEQLRERRKLLAALVAFGTRRRTLCASVLWQTAVPIALGITLATATGLALGAVLLGMVDRSVRFDWTAVGIMAGTGAGVVMVVTALSLPSLWRMMRPEGLRTE
ncbi:ABC transporter permease [Streptomyces phyllanthi]|uniref:ABC transporter permease n=1 Tax=Streptomyces phyllanthi TaxID=1803180 RepID=A0A5N8W183_9ACTN|nr:FtsX-like permease family protein [Streptomyces phyllanthi]MPY40842.1 ABC transporter permease [Streptomyces phyllanthi]